MNESGPDVPEIACWVRDGCCLPPPCAISEDDFICAIRALLPEGDLFNNTRQALYDPPKNIGVITVGCARVGCEQLILGDCCDDSPWCEEDPIAPQLAVIDSYAAVAYRVVQELCKMTFELDPCTASTTLRQWADRMGLPEHWSDKTLSQVLCIWPNLRGRVWNWATLQEIAGRFGASVTLREAGDMNCDPAFAQGWWTMARDRAECPQLAACPPSAKPAYMPPVMHMDPSCGTLPLSLNLILCPSEIRTPANCNLPGNQVSPHDPDLYAAFKELLPRILPQPVFWCSYDCDPANCIQ